MLLFLYSLARRKVCKFLLTLRHGPILFCGITILQTLDKKDLARYLVLIYSLLDLSDKIDRSSVIYLSHFFPFSIYLHFLKNTCG